MARRKSRSGGGARGRRRSVEVEVVGSPPTSPTSEPTQSAEDIVFGKEVGTATSPAKEELAGHCEHTDWQALLPTVSGSSMFEETPDKVLGEDTRSIRDVVAPFMCKKMQATWGPPNAGWIPQRTVSPTSHPQHEQERQYKQQQQEEQLQQQLLQQQQHDAYCFYQHQQQHQQQLYYQQQQQQQQQQMMMMMMMTPSPVMAPAQFRVAASA
eukprot:COSAG02_NODE_3161_length_7251_cov_51.907159_3_plen_211_part_00